MGARYACDEHPRLRIAIFDKDTRNYRYVCFEDGRAEVADGDKQAVAALTAHPAVRAVGGRPPKQ
jgi:hypothetical protein